LPRLHRVGPSASLDETSIGLSAQSITAAGACQSFPRAGDDILFHALVNL
jgi:hypothetical protein